ncbi:MAG: hypothetical protein ACLQUY_07385 [Ktedonobacterales bacterium]
MPAPRYPDHYALAVAKQGLVETSIRGAPLDALLRALIVLDNPYQTPHP